MRVAAALCDLGDGANAQKTLGLGKKSAAEAALNMNLSDAPCAPAIDLYSGVLYDHLDHSTLTAPEQQRMNAFTWIFSGLFGIVRPADFIPNHRLAINTKLPPLGNMGTWWRTKLREKLPDLAKETIIDCRSGGYRSMYPAQEANVIEITAEEDRPGGRKVVTHAVKKWRGMTARHFIRDNALSGQATVMEVLASLERFVSKSDDVLSVEICAPKDNKQGGSIITANLVIAKTMPS
jgi:Uncharacterized protein conserved in bacteria